MAGGQTKTLPDAQVEANVLKAFAGALQLANQSITTTTVDGVVTLSGSVTDEGTQTLAETLASKAQGVQKVVDQLSIGAPAASSPPDASSPDWGPAGPPPDVAANGQPNGGQLQSDGTMAPPPPPPPAGGDAAGNPPAQQQPYPAQQSPYPQQGPTPYPQQGTPAYRQPYNGQQGYAQQQAPTPYGAQVAGKPVTIPNGSLVRVRINQGLDSKHTKAGTIFDATVLNDVVADGEVAIPRGASVQGTVVESKNSGALGGHGEIALQLTQVTLGGRVFPIVSDEWTHDGRDKTGQTVGNAVGLGAFGALIGAVAGGGPGAAIGAAAGAGAGIGASAASGGARVVVPAEAILTFHLTQPAPVQTVSQAEMDRLGYGVQAGQMQRRPPPPPPGYYRPYPPPYAY